MGDAYIVTDHHSDQRPTMPEEIIDLTGKTPVSSNPQQSTQTNTIRQSVGRIEGVSQGVSDTDLLDALLNAPAASLIPWETCQLPSQGIYYNWPAGSTVEVRAMSQNDEKILANQRLAKSNQSIEALFRACCRFPENFDPIDLLIGDRTFLLYYLRGITHGHEYEFVMTCPNQTCGKVSTHCYDLNLLIQTVRVADHSLGAEPFIIELPHLSATVKRSFTVGLRFLRAGDINAMAGRYRAGQRLQRGQTVRNRQANNGQVPADLDGLITEQLEHAIVSVLGVDDRFKVKQFVERLHATDAGTIRQWLKEHTPGIDTTVDVTCPECEVVSTVELPITESFFRPQNRG